MTGAGFRELRVSPVDETVNLGGLAPAVDFLAKMGPAAESLRNASEVDRKLQPGLSIHALSLQNYDPIEIRLLGEPLAHDRFTGHVFDEQGALLHELPLLAAQHLRSRNRDALCTDAVDLGNECLSAHFLAIEVDGSRRDADRRTIRGYIDVRRCFCSIRNLRGAL